MNLMAVDANHSIWLCIAAAQAAHFAAAAAAARQPAGTPARGWPQQRAGAAAAGRSRTGGRDRWQSGAASPSHHADSSFMNGHGGAGGAPSPARRDDSRRDRVPVRGMPRAALEGGMEGGREGGAR
jgi:hypothetical protein